MPATAPWPPNSPPERSARILEVGAFQLLLLDRVPAYAAINEAVEAARRTVRPGRGRKVAGFVNALLRNLQRLVAGHDPAGRPAPDAVPHPDGGVVRLAEPVLPDPADGGPGFLGAAYSYPDWLVARWLDAFGEEAEAVCRWQNRRPRVFARVNPMRHTAEEMLAALRVEVPGVALGPRPGVLDVSAVPADRLQRLASAGDLTVQDPSAMAAVEALGPQPGEAALDLCAAPGTKTTQIVEAMGDRGLVVACDKREAKLESLRHTAQARGLRSVTVCLADDVAEHVPEGGFDAVLVDAPCSNTGVLARRVEARWRLRVEARWRLRPGDPADLAALQRRLLERATGLVRPGGRLVYATCSLLPEENDGLLASFLEGDGAFWALLRRE